MPDSEDDFLSKNPTYITPEKIYNLLKRKQLGLADIQRASVWDKKRAKQINLFRSMYLGIPVGVLYVWEAEGADKKRSRHLEGMREFFDRDRIKWLILDGQQRTTAIARLHLSSRPDFQNHLDRLVLDLSKDARTEEAFRFETNTEYVPKPHEVVIQDLLYNVDNDDETGLSAETNRIMNGLEGQQEFDPANIAKNLSRANDAFTSRQIAVQYIKQSANLSDALHIFSTVNQAGVPLSDIDLIQATLTSIYPDFHHEIYKLVRELQRVLIGEDDAGEPVYSEMRNFDRDTLIKALMWKLYGTTKRNDSRISDNLTIYGPKVPIDPDLGEDLQPLDSDKVESVFEEIKLASKTMKAMLKNELFFTDTIGHSKNSILGGIIFYLNNPTPSSVERGKILLWYLLGSYHLEWTGGSTDIKVDDMCRSFSNPAGVNWDSLWKSMRENSSKDERKESIGETGNVEDLFPQIGENQFPGLQSGTTGKISGIIDHLLKKSIPFSYRMRDWFTGEKLRNLNKGELSIHHIFPQSRFKWNRFTDNLVKGGYGYGDLSEESKHRSITLILGETIASQEGRKDELEVKIVLEESIAIELKEKIDSGDLTEIEIDEHKKMRRRALTRLSQARKNLTKVEEDLEKLVSVMSDVENDNGEKAELFGSCCEFWFSFADSPTVAKNHPANLVSIKKNSNSSIGNQWPDDYLMQYSHQKKRIEQQFFDFSDFGIFQKERYSDFISRRTKLQHEKLTHFFNSLLDGTWGSVEEPEEPTLEELIHQASETNKVEFKETVFVDVRLGLPTWEVLPNVKYLKAAVVRAVLSFGNSGGGSVIIGCEDLDEGVSIRGLERDFEAIMEKKRFGLAKAKEYMKDSIVNEIENCNQPFCGRLEINFEEVDEKELLVIKANPTGEVILQKKYPKTKITVDSVELKEWKKNVHWVRIQGSTREFNQ